MKERPILFSAAMVRAILGGQKTQTRRVVKPQPSPDFLPQVGNYHRTLVDKKDGEQFPDPVSRYGASDENEDYPCPHGQPGDRLWVRETFQECPECGRPDYAADVNRPRNCRSCDATLGKWRPSIHMPRWASRITLEIVAVRVERLRKISCEDAMAEGIDHYCPGVTAALRGESEADPREEYRDLWESINGAGSWEANPWVWVIEFRKLEK